MDDAEGAVAVLDGLRHDAQRHHVVDLIELDLLALQFLMDAEQALDAAIDFDDRHLRFGELGRDRLLQLLDQPFGCAPPLLDPQPQRLVGGRFEVLERQLLELVLDLAHPQAIGDRGVDVPGLLRNLDPALFGKVVERPHVVQAVGELHQDDPDVVDHRQQHLAEVFRLPLLARRERDRAQLGHALDNVGDIGAEQFRDALDRRLGVFDDVVEQPGGDRHDVELHVGELIRHLQGVHEIRFPRVANLPLVLEGGEHVGPPQQVNIGVRVDPPDFFDEVLEPDHEVWCLTGTRGVGPWSPVDGVFFCSLYWPGSGAGNPHVRASTAENPGKTTRTNSESILIPSFERGGALPRVPLLRRA